MLLRRWALKACKNLKEEEEEYIISKALLAIVLLMCLHFLFVSKTIRIPYIILLKIE